jgi:hypothetical protein
MLPRGGLGGPVASPRRGRAITIAATADTAGLAIVDDLVDVRVPT